MHRTHTPLRFAALLVCLAATLAATPITIDDFNGSTLPGNVISVTIPGGAPASKTVTGDALDGPGAGTIMGGQRDIMYSFTRPLDFGADLTTDIEIDLGNANEAAVTTPTRVRPDYVRFLYDGADGSATTNALGLGSVNFNAGGNDQFTFYMTADQNSTLTITVWQNALGNSRTATVPITGGFNGNLSVLYSAFGAGYLAFFSDIDAVQFELGSAVSGADFTLDSFGLTQFVPEPGTMGMLGGALVALGLIARKKHKQQK